MKPLIWGKGPRKPKPEPSRPRRIKWPERPKVDPTRDPWVALRAMIERKEA